MMKVQKVVFLSALLGALGAAFSACSGASSGSEAPANAVSSICSKFVACGTADGTTGTPYTQSSCVSDFTGWVPPAGCADAIASASCGTINGGAGSSTQAICFPTCPAIGATTCNGDSISVCVGATDAGATSGTSLVEECSATCSANGQTYTGVCGASYQGQASASGQDTCWCNGGGDASVGEAAAPSRSCQGTPTPCASLEQGYCTNNCVWSATCAGTPATCSANTTLYYCADILGCTWNDAETFCEGTAYPCSEIVSRNYAPTCYAQAGCAPSGSCSGTTTPCASATDETTCTSEPGCTWQ